MEEYVKVSDLNNIIRKLATEPAYYHEGEDFYNGICAIEGELMRLSTVKFEEPKAGTWTRYSSTMMECSACKEHVPYHRYEFCPHCGVRMGRNQNDL